MAYYIELVLLLVALPTISCVEQNTCDCTCMCSPKVDIFIPPSGAVATTGEIPSPIATIVLRDCPADFHMFNHTCYYVTPPVSDSKGDEAGEVCSDKNDNSAMVTINNAHELNFLVRNIIRKKFPVTGLYWTGGRSSQSGWYWQRTGAPLSPDILSYLTNTTVLPDYCLFLRTSQSAVLLPLPCKDRFHAGVVCDIPLP